MPTPDHPLLDAVRGALERLVECCMDNEGGSLEACVDHIQEARQALAATRSARVEVWWRVKGVPEELYETPVSHVIDEDEWERVVVLGGGEA